VLNLGRLTRLDYLYMSRTVLNADVLISLPKLKMHHWAGVTLSLKNLFGTLPGICYGWPKNELHWRGIPNSIVDINCTRGPNLAIVDGIVGMEGDGPLHGKARRGRDRRAAHGDRAGAHPDPGVRRGQAGRAAGGGGDSATRRADRGPGPAIRTAAADRARTIARPEAGGELGDWPMRIVSLLPSATEIVCALGLGDQLVGVTHECDHPDFVRALPKVTTTLIPTDATSGEIDALVRERLKTQRALYSLDLPALERLAPDLIVTQALCDVCAVAEAEVEAAACRLPGRPRVLNLEPTSLRDVFETLRLVGRAAGVEARAGDVVRALRDRVAAVAERSARVRRPRVLLLEWLDPPFSCGHWSPELVSLAGGEEVIGTAGTRSRTLGWSQVAAARPDAIVLACCGFSVERTLLDLPGVNARPEWREAPAVGEERVFVVDGSAYFSRPGPRLVDSLEILAHALHPHIHTLPAGLPPARRLTARELSAVR
jgi:iron complex transport system substrate-binding protein